ncbi:MAG: hypothetical protein EBU96_06535 [Actinobacteria bacterium]|nr:hypothetical protein [Actinomycetota bacterium]
MLQMLLHLLRLSGLSQLLRKTSRWLLIQMFEDIRLFDVYEGAQVPEGHKSLAFALRFRAQDRTLAAEEVAAARQAGVDAAGKSFGATLR